MKAPTTVKALEDLGRVRLSKSFFLRDFLFSEIATVHGLSNTPDDPDLAIAAGRRLCEDLLEVLQDRFGRIAIRSAYRSCTVNAYGNEHGYNCARNKANYAAHICDCRDAKRRMGATACVVDPVFWDTFQADGDWRKLAWWIHDNLPHSSLYFFPKMWAFIIQWRDDPEHCIDSYTVPKGCLTKQGMANHQGGHEDLWCGIEKAMIK